MLFFRSIIVTLLLTLVSGARLRLRREAQPLRPDLVLRTNAARMAAGLGPLPPRSLRPSVVQGGGVLEIIRDCLAEVLLI